MANFLFSETMLTVRSALSSFLSPERSTSRVPRETFLAWMTWKQMKPAAAATRRNKIHAKARLPAEAGGAGSSQALGSVSGTTILGAVRLGGGGGAEMAGAETCIGGAALLPGVGRSAKISRASG